MIILGAGGHAKEILDILISKKYDKEIILIDELIKHDNTFLNTYRVTNSIKNLNTNQNNFIVGVGKINLRKRLSTIALNNGLNWIGVRSENIIIGNINVNIDYTVDIMQNVTISGSVTICKGTLINRNVSIHHDVTIGENCVISPGVQILGNCNIGNNVFIGAGCTILPKIKIDDNAIIGAGSLVNKNIPESTKTFGVPISF